MTKRLLNWIGAGICLVCLLAAGSVHTAERLAVTIAVFPCTDAVSSFKKFHPLIDYLTASTKYDVQLVFQRTPEIYEKALNDGELDFVLQDPHIYVRLAHLYDSRSLLRTLGTDGMLSQSGFVIVRRDSGIEDLAGVRNRTVMFGPSVSSARWIAARALFKKNNIDIDSQLAGYSNGECCEDIAFNVLLNEVDAGVVCDHFLGMHPGKQRELGVDASQLKVIAKTEPVPTKVFVATRKVAPAVVDSVGQALLALDRGRPEHRKILAQAELGGFRKAHPSDLSKITKMLNDIARE